MSLILSGTNGLSDVDGSAATPAIRGTDTNTGIFFPAADTVAFAEGGVEAMRLDASGNLGIGTTSPQSYSNYKILHVAGPATNGSGLLYFTNSNNSLVGIANADGANSLITFGSQTNHAVTFKTNDTERARIDTSGNLLVGTTSTYTNNGISVTSAFVTPTSGVWALGARNTHASNPYGLNVNFQNAAPNGTSNEFLLCTDSGAIRASIRSNGGLANYSANNVNLASDFRLKHDIEPVKSYWNVFKALEWKTWIYNDQTDDIKNIGVIAQELQALAPELVCESNALPTPDGEAPYLGLWENDFKMAAMSVITELVKKSEEQQAMIASQSAIITQLQADVAALKGQA